MVRRPPGYPRELERRLTLADGRVVHIRPVVPGDASALVHAIRTADAETLRARFLGARPPEDPQTIRHLVEVDYRTRLALVAFGAGRGVAIARYEPMPDSPGTAEIAVAVDPAWRRVGLATAMVRLLAEAAAARGISHLAATYYAWNGDVASIISGFGVPHHVSVEAGVVDEEVDLPTSEEAENVAAFVP
jgi:GNAT superfamily N-acetyltransferase